MCVAMNNDLTVGKRHFLKKPWRKKRWKADDDSYTGQLWLLGWLKKKDETSNWEMKLRAE